MNMFSSNKAFQVESARLTRRWAFGYCSVLTLPPGLGWSMAGWPGLYYRGCWLFDVTMFSRFWTRDPSQLRNSEFTQNFWVFSVNIADFWQTFWVIWENGSNWSNLRLKMSFFALGRLKNHKVPHLHPNSTMFMPLDRLQLKIYAFSGKFNVCSKCVLLSWIKICRDFTLQTQDLYSEIKELTQILLRISEEKFGGWGLWWGLCSFHWIGFEIFLDFHEPHFLSSTVQSSFTPWRLGHKSR